MWTNYPLGKILELQFQADAERHATNMEHERSKSELLRSQLEAHIKKNTATEEVMKRTDEVLQKVEYLCDNTGYENDKMQMLEVK